jgi:hypothetical protein
VALKDIIAADIRNVFLRDESDFADTIGYTPANGGTERGILAIVTAPTEEDLMQVSAALNYRVKRIRVSALDDVAGVVKPNRLGMPGEGGGDQVRLPASKDAFAATWYVRHIVSSGFGTHMLVIVDNQGAARV